MRCRYLCDAPHRRRTTSVWRRSVGKTNNKLPPLSPAKYFRNRRRNEA